MKDKILNILREQDSMSVSQMAEFLNISRQMVHRILLDLQEQALVEKLGKPPKTFYRLAEVKTKEIKEVSITTSELGFLRAHFLNVTASGQRQEGIDAFETWCEKQKLQFKKTLDEFILTRKKYLVYKDDDGLISGLQKIKNTQGFSQIGLDELFYEDFYAIERFGKTRLGQLIHFAKQGQNKKMMKEIVVDIRPSILQLIKREHIKAVGFIPPTIKREVQIMKVLEKDLNLVLPGVKIIKIKGDIVIPQKALNKLEDRIENARSSIFIEEIRHYNTILLIDDAVGSGATLNETAIKLKSQGLAQRVIGYAVTGSFKGFDVITEV
ncbi:MAG: winged helix-turn-helix transcriptional regulator [Bacteroidota bacterium]|nr:winged helix-turn-helix transcriptional regulator [Bacteroidota bacterium]